MTKPKRKTSLLKAAALGIAATFGALSMAPAMASAAKPTSGEQRREAAIAEIEPVGQCFELPSKSPESTKLKFKERRAIHDIFDKKEIDSKAITKNRYDCYYFGVAGSVAFYEKENVNFYSGFYSDNFGDKEENFLRYMVAMHEATHLWQNQMEKEMPACMFTQDKELSCRNYDYKLDSGKKFDDFYHEEQGALIGDYVLVFFKGEDPLMLGHQDKEMLKKTVEDRFPNAKKTRKGLERRANLRNLPSMGGGGAV